MIMLNILIIIIYVPFSNLFSVFGDGLKLIFKKGISAEMLEGCGGICL